MERAASLMIVREGREVLLVRRAAPGLLDGTWAFPGGRVVDADRDVGGCVDARGLDADACALRLAAVREVFEETGLLALPHATRIPTERLADHRATLLAGRTTLPEILRTERLLLDLSRIEPAGRYTLEGYVTPPLEVNLHVVHLDRGPGGRAEPQADEVSSLAWMRPEEAVESWLRAEMAIPPSVLAPLRSLAGLPDPDLPLPAHEILRGVILVPLESPTLPPATHTNAFLLGTGAERILVDPGSPWEAPNAELDRLLELLAEQGARVREIWLTHHHGDHVGGARRLRERLGVPVRAHPETARRVEPGLVDAPLADGEKVSLPGAPAQRWVALHTPGHAPGHLCFLEEHTGACLVGDLMAGVGTVIVDPPEGNMADYFASLRRLRALVPRMAFPAHGPPSGSPLRLIDAYVLHRQAREDAVVDALAHGAVTPPEMVTRVYTDVPPAMHPLAERNVLAHLEKLEAEGRVAREDGRYRLT